MGDPLSATASILAVIDLAAHSCGSLYHFVRSYAEASDDLRHYAITLQALQSSFRGISLLESEAFDPTFFTPEFQTRMQDCILDLQALERLIKPTRTRCEAEGVTKRVWTRIRWASVDQKAKLRRCLERIERHRTTFSLDLLLLNIRLSLRPANQLAADPDNGFHPPTSTFCVIPSKCSNINSAAHWPQHISPRSGVFGFLEYDSLHLYWWYGSNTIQKPQHALTACSAPSKATNGYGISIGAAMYGCLPFRIKAAVYLSKIWTGWSSQFSLNWTLSLPRTISWDDYQIELAMNGNVGAIKELFSKGDATPFEVLPDGSTLLHVAVSRNHVDMVTLLLQQGANVNAINDFGETPLHLALAFAKDYNISRLLLEHNGDLHNRNADHKTPLHTFYSPVLKQVLSCHSDYLDLSAPDRYGMSILHFLAWSSKTSSDEFRDFHERSHISLDATNTDGLSLLHLAAQRGNIAIIQYITQASTTTTTTTTTATRNLLHLQDRKGRTALHHAVENKRGAQAAGILLSRGADMSARDQDGRTALHHAAKLGRLPAVERLVAASESAHLLHAVDIEGMTPRTVAMLHARDDVVTFLSGQMAARVETGAQMVTNYSCGNAQWAGDDARDKVSADLPSSSSSSSSSSSFSSEKWEIARWVERRRWPVVEMSGYASQLSIRYFLVVCIIIMSMMVMWKVGAIIISSFYTIT